MAAEKPPKSKVYICLGGNLGDIESSIRTALELLAKTIGECVKVSKIYDTVALTTDGPDTESVPAYKNCAALFLTSLSANEVLKECLKTEAALGRARDINNKYQSRSIDIDIALYGDTKYQDEDLIIPHPRMHERDFVLVPLLDIDPTLKDPGTNLPLSDLLKKISQRYIKH